MGEKDFLGEECIASSRTLRLITAITISDGAMIRIKKSTMISLLKTQHRFSEMFVAFLISRNARYQEALADQLFNSSEKCLARVLLQLAQLGKDGVAERVVPKMTHELLAKWLGRHGCVSASL